MSWQSRRHHWLVLLGLILVLWVHGCTQSGTDRATSTDARPSVVSTSTILTDLSQAIAENTIQLTGILKPGSDPHVYEPVPADTRAMEEADLIVYNGYNLEPGLIRLMNSAGSRARKVAVGEAVPPLQLAKEGQQLPDPHVWGDARNGVRMVDALRDALIEVLPAERDRLTQNAAKLTQTLNRLDTWIKQQIQTIPLNNRKLITTHDAFQYYGRAYGLALSGTLIGISTEEQPSAQTVQKLVEAVKTAGVPAIFAETTINPALIQTVAQEAGVRLAPQQLYSDSIGAPGSNADTYVKMMVANTRTIVEALGGKIQPFSDR